MGLFGSDHEIDKRLDAIEEWLLGLTKVIQQHKLDTTEIRIELMKLNARVGEKLTEEDFDPAIMRLNEGLAEARVLAAQASDAAEESWQTLQKIAQDKIDELNSKLDEVS